MRRGRTPALVLCLLLAPATAFAGGHTAFTGGFSVSPSHDGVIGERWDDSHMRTRYRSVLSIATPSTAVSGADRYGQIETDTGEAARTVVPTTLSSATQRAWQKAPPRSVTSRSSGGASTLGQLVTHGRRFGSAGSSPSGRGSSLRSGSIHRSRR